MGRQPLTGSHMASSSPPLRLASLGTSPPRRGGEDGSQAGHPSSPSRSGGEVSSPELVEGRDGEGGYAMLTGCERLPDLDSPARGRVVPELLLARLSAPPRSAP